MLEGIDRVIAVQRPVVLLHIRQIRSRRPSATPDEVVAILERRYLAAVTTGGAAVGATAMLPAVGTAAALALSGAETVGFLGATALFAQSVTEVHGIALEDPERARALVLALLIGGPSQELLKQFASQATGRGRSRTAFWGEQITKTLPRAVVDQVANTIRTVYLPKFFVTEAGSVVGRILPFGIGAVIGGVGNQMVGRTVVRAARSGFGPAPAQFPASLALTVRSRRVPRSSQPSTARPKRTIIRRKTTTTNPPPPAAETLRGGPPPA